MRRTALPGNQDTGFQHRLLVLRFKSTLSCLQLERLRPWGLNPYMKAFLISCPINGIPVLSTVDIGQKQRGLSICFLDLINPCISSPLSKIIARQLKLLVRRFRPDLKMPGVTSVPLYLGVLHSNEKCYGEDGQKNGRVLLNVKRCT